MRFKLTQECGQKWYRPHSWRACASRGRMLVHDGVKIGWAFGPVMFFWRWQ